MRRVHVMIGFTSLLGAALVAGPAMAVTAPTGHLNVRSGPRFQYPVGNLQANTPAQITGCVTDYSWCAVALPGGATGWASAPYLVTKAEGTPKNLQGAGAELGILTITPVNTGAAVVATPPLGDMVPVPASVGVVQPIAPPPNVVSYVTTQTIQPVIVDGEVMVGAAFPAAARVYPIPSSPYVFSYVNGQRALVEPTARKIVYVVQSMRRR
jgi:uncharacterized protein YraI